MKKGLLQKLFPAKQSINPRIRFNGFNQDWEQRELGEIAEIVRGASPRPIQDPKWFDAKSDIGWLRISDVTEQNGRIQFLEQRISKIGQEKTRVILNPHLLLSIAATVGKPVINNVPTGVHDGFLIFTKPKFDLEFMFQYLEMFRPNWQKYGQPGSQINLNSEIVKNHELLLPYKEEQIYLGVFFKNIDDTITLLQKELEMNKQIKKGFLQKLFPKE
nr:restriction endonuclease subunit S [Macrococcus caseolyticus]